ncbi:ankyrin repeat domain-containing protein [Anaerobaca lacustris]|uniref:Ankyrin repeat domain-containing protein n=1 Tax=Anaerobaca lacustris TaxID=3044600 RepID=A0AAW6U0K7_9BACT|nr:ankyrin repeat domain-containing protein [Sedimentisphaerales bacterium M17dextr]
MVLLVTLCGCKRQRVDVDAALHEAVGSGSLSQVRALLARGADPDVRNRHGWTPLQRAAEQGHAAMVELLMKYGADPDVDGPWGPALHIAIVRGHAAVVRKLIDGGAHVNVRDKRIESRTALDRALSGAPRVWRDEVIDILLAAGADPRLSADSGRTVLHGAASEGLTKLASLLLAHGADVNAQTAGGSTPLHSAVWENHLETATLLLDHGADINRADQVGDTPLHVAAVNGYAALFDLLRDRQANLHARDDLGQTPLDCLRSPDEPNMVILHADGQRPYEVILTLPTTVRSFLIGYGVEFDRVWTPDGNDIAALDLEAAIKAADHIATRSWFSINYVLEHLSRYHREYGGFLAAGRRYLLCNMNYTHVDKTPTDKFTWGMDGACALVRIVVDLENNVVVRIDCN